MTHWANSQDNRLFQNGAMRSLGLFVFVVVVILAVGVVEGRRGGRGGGGRGGGGRGHLSEVVLGECHFFLPSSSRKDYDVVW